MKITSVELFQKKYRLERGPFAMSGGRVVTEQESTIVRVQAGGGEFGWGEQCSFSPAYIPGHANATQAAIALLATAIIGCDPREVEKVHLRMDRAVVGHEYAKSALDIACWDLFGRSTGLRLSELLGGTMSETVPLYKSLSLGEPAAMAKEAARAAGQGYQVLQVKVGDFWKEDLERVCSVLAAAPGAGRVVVDANGRWPQHEAIRVAALFRDLDLYLEQPCATSRECGAVRRSAGKPMVLDESLTDFPALLDAAHAQSLDVARLKLSRWGGITPARKARDFCVGAGIGVSVEDSAGGDIVSAAALHLAASTPAHALFDAFIPSGEVTEHVSVEPVLPDKGHGVVPKGAGLGVEVDEGLLGPQIGRYP